MGCVIGLRECVEKHKLNTRENVEKVRVEEAIKERKCKEVCVACLGLKSVEETIDCDNTLCNKFWPRIQSNYSRSMLDKELSTLAW